MNTTLKAYNLLLVAFAVLISVGFVLGGCTTGSGPQSPNVVILFIDDQGYGDLSSYGHPTIETPHIDSLADQGTHHHPAVLQDTECLAGVHDR